MKKEFDFKKYVVGNKATLGSKLETVKTKKLIKEAEEDEFDSSAFEKEPSAKDIKKTTTSVSGNYKKRTQLAKLTQQKDTLLKQLKANKITIDQYKQQIGSIPQQIKTLTADLKRMPGFDDEVEPDLDEIHPIEKGRMHRMQKPSKSSHERMEGLADTIALAKLHSALEILVPDWIQDGFEEEDILDYMKRLVWRNA